MSLETLRVKTEVEEVCVKEEPGEECENEDTGAHVKERVCADSAALCELYAGHQVKDELVLGPEELHRPCVSSALPATLNRASSGVGRACSCEQSDCTDKASEPYQCHHCGKGFRNKSVLRKHVYTHLSKPSAGPKKSLTTCSKKHPVTAFVNCGQCNYTT